MRRREENPTHGAAQLRLQLSRMRALRRERLRTAGSLPLRLQLTRWQGERLATTHADLLASERYGDAVRFFLSHLYAPKDFSQRDRQLESLSSTLLRVLPGKAILTLAQALEMNVLTGELDERLLNVWSHEMSLPQPLDEATYAEAYRQAGDREDRLRQITLLQRVGQDLDSIVARPLIYPTLALAREPARAAGLESLHSLLIEGFLAFRHMRGAKEFLATLVRRETRIVERIHAGHPQPFETNVNRENLAKK